MDTEAAHHLRMPRRIKLCVGQVVSPANRRTLPPSSAHALAHTHTQNTHTHKPRDDVAITHNYAAHWYLPEAQRFLRLRLCQSHKILIHSIARLHRETQESTPIINLPWRREKDRAHACPEPRTRNHQSLNCLAARATASRFSRSAFSSANIALLLHLAVLAAPRTASRTSRVSEILKIEDISAPNCRDRATCASWAKGMGGLGYGGIRAAEVAKAR